MIEALAAVTFPLLMIAAGTGDVLTLRIPNWLNLFIAGCFLVLALAAGMPWGILGLHLAAGTGMLVLGALLLGLGLFGGGDAKLLASASLWIGVEGLLPFLFATSLAGGLLALWIAGSRLLPGARRTEPGRADVPYGFAIAAGAIVAFTANGFALQQG
jgi:prepilin peptidase CpaA